MRYLKSAALLLLTASSSASLLSAGAKAARGVPDGDIAEAVGDVKSESPTVRNEIQKVQPKVTTLPLPTASTIVEPAPDTSGVQTPQFDRQSSQQGNQQSGPQYARLRARLFGPNAQSLPPEVSRQTAEPLSADAAFVEAVPIEVVSTEAAAKIASPRPEAFIQQPRMTLDGFRQLIETTAESVASGSMAEDAGVGRAIAQNDSPDPLPTLEEGDPPTPVEAAEPADPNLPTTDPLDLPTEEIPADPGTPSPDDSDAEDPDTETSEPEAAETEDADVPAAEAVEATEIDGLPDTLFSDPNPLNFPTQGEEVDIEQNPVVTLEEAIQLAYQNNQVLQQAQLSLEQAEAALAAQQAARLPTVSAGANLTNTQDEGSRTVLGGSVEVGYDVLTGGSRAASIRAAELQQQVSALAVEAQQEQIRLATATAYYALQESGEQIRINQSFLDEAARNLRDAQLRQEVGVGTRFDTLRAEVQFANARQSLIQSQGNQRIARRDIARLLNLPPTSGLSATPVDVADTWPLTLEESILLAFQNRAELEQQLLQADISEQQRQIALAAVRPQLSVFANYSGQSILEGATVFEDDFQDSVSVGARFNWTLYDGGAARANARQQEIASMIAEEQFSENLDQVRFDVEQAFFNLQTNQENILTSQVAVAQAEEALALANLRLQAGVGTQLDVLTAQSELTEAQVNNVTAVLGYNRARVSIERAISNVVSDF